MVLIKGIALICIILMYLLHRASSDNYTSANINIEETLKYNFVSIVLHLFTKRIMEIRNRIITGATELFFKYGIKTITMDDLSKSLAISKKTLYLYFQDKNELVCSVTDNYLKGNQKTFDKITADSKDPVEEVLNISEHMKLMFQNVNPSILFETQKYYPNAFAIYQKHKEECIRTTLVKNIEWGKNLGLYRKEIDQNIISVLRLEQIQMGFNTAIFPHGVYNLAKVQLQFIDHFLHGICTIKGHKLINKYKQISEEE